MEEWVGQKWHHFITRHSDVHCQDAVVRLSEIDQQLAIFFRALGGDTGLTIGHTSAKPIAVHRNWLQRMSGTGRKAELGHFHNDHFYLPEQLDCFPSRALNEALYFWLAAMGSFNRSPKTARVIEHNRLLTQQVLTHWPGMHNHYDQLVRATLRLRTPVARLPEPVQSAELAIRQVLLKPMSDQPLSYDPGHMPQPVLLWLSGVSDDQIKQLQRSSAAMPSGHGADKQQRAAAKKRYQAEQVDEQQDKDGFMSFRLESLFSWSEFINLDRGEDDSEDDDATRVADDLDKMSINQGETSHAIRLDLDLPASEYDDEVVAEGILLPEWDHKTSRYLPDHCALQLMALKTTDDEPWPGDLHQQANRLKRQFEAIRPVSTWHNHQADGTEIDVNAYLDFSTQKLQRQHQPDPMLYRQLIRQHRDLSTLILTDLSLSTDAHANNEKKVIDVIKEALFLLATSLHAAGERFAIAGFTSKKRSHVRYYPIKNFDAPFDEACEAQIRAIKPAYYTRMGAAIRYASQMLGEQNTQQKLLLILTDGKPNDLDKYETRYGLEDTRKAIQEAKTRGLTPFCVSVDYLASDYLPYLFGHQGFIHLNNIMDLPKKLPKLFVQLIH
jgi:nitric oxide reductase NorD protein